MCRLVVPNGSIYLSLLFPGDADAMRGSVWLVGAPFHPGPLGVPITWAAGASVLPQRNAPSPALFFFFHLRRILYACYHLITVNVASPNQQLQVSIYMTLVNFTTSKCVVGFRVQCLTVRLI